MPIWLKSTGLYSVSKNSYYALGLTAVAIFTTILCGIGTDLWGKRWKVNIFMSVSLVFTSILLLVWDIPLWLKFTAFYLGGIGYAGQGSNFAWANEVCRTDQERAFTLFSMNMWSNAVTAWWILIFWPVTSAPKYHKGMIVTIPIAVVSFIIAGVTQWLWTREKRANAQVGQERRGEEQADRTQKIWKTLI
ncbi:hypothetical protein BT69DRAFT_993967 [Atractiella rhizophila]|nr:hypothetical protein BT69DRAFT_993967 [Atractiella rhizophila]